MLTYDEYKELLYSSFANILPSNYRMKVDNEIIYVKKQGINLRASIPLDKVYEEACTYKEQYDYFQDAKSMKELSENIFCLVQEMLETEYLKQLDTELVNESDTINLDNLCKHLYAELISISGESASGMAKDRIIEYIGNDLGIGYRLKYGDNSIGEPLSKEALFNIYGHCDGYEEDDVIVKLYEAAMKNSTEDYVLAEISRTSFSIPDGVLDNKLYYIMGKNKYTSACIANSAIRKEIESEIGSNKYIVLPVSKHNLMIYPYDNQPSKEVYIKLQQAVRNLYTHSEIINKAEPNSKLSDSIYRYDAKRNRYITITDGIEEDLSKSKKTINVFRRDCWLDLVSSFGISYNMVRLPDGTKIGDKDLGGGYINPPNNTISVNEYNNNYCQIEYNNGAVFKVSFDGDRASEIVAASELAKAVDNANRAIYENMTRIEEEQHYHIVTAREHNRNVHQSENDLESF